MRLVKLSTAAAVAAGLATSASAVELTEAIKGVDVSGYVRYRMEAFGEDHANDENNHKYKYRVKFTVPVNDAVSAVLNTGNINGEDTLNDTYGNSNPGLLHAYFQYTGVENMTVQAGKVPMPTPFNDDQHGNGIVGLYNAGPVTVGAGAFDSHNAGYGSGNDIMALGVIGSANIVNYSAWYAEHQNMFDAMSIAADMEMDMFKVGVRHSTLSLDAGGDNALTQINASMDMDNINVRAGYGMTDEEGGLVGYDTDAAVSFQQENLTMHNRADASGFKVGAGTSFGKMSADVDYFTFDYTTPAGVDTDASEIVPAVAYQMSDNFKMRLFHSMIEEDSVDMTETQLELRYDF